MRDLLLLASLAAVFAFGWFLMGRLDRFLENSRQDLEEWGILCYNCISNEGKKADDDVETEPGAAAPHDP